MGFKLKRPGFSQFKGKNKEKGKTSSIKEKSIGKRMILSTTTILVGLTLVLGLTSYFIAKNEILKSNNELLLNKAVDSANLVNEQIKSYTVAVETLGSLDIIANPEIPIKEKFNSLEQEKIRLRLSSIGLADIQGNLLLDDGTSLDIYEKEYFQMAKAGHAYFSEPMKNDATGKTEVVIAAPLKYKGLYLGAIVASKPADEFYRIAENIKIGEKGFAFILNDVADVISHPTVTSHASNSDASSGPINFSGLKERVNNEFVDDVDIMNTKIQNNESGIGKYMENGKIVHLGFAPIKSKGWTLVASIDESEVLAGLNSLKDALLIAIIVAIIAGIVFSLLFSRNLTKSIVQITDCTYKLSQLDLTHNIEEKLLLRKDELGKMAYSLQVVIDNIRNFAKEIGESSQQVAASSEELSAISEESTAAASNIAENSSEIAGNSNLQLDEVLNITSSIKEISTQVDYVSTQTNNAENFTSSVIDKTKIGKEKIEEVIVQMKNIEDSTHSVESSLNDISEGSTEMNHMLEIIENVAEETNLLALNAAIEAARAGEYGRGFAVVADEIRKLAEETQKSTGEIYSLINNNNVLIKEANEKMVLGNNEVKLGTTKVSETKETFDEIADSISQITTGINEVVKAIQNVEDHVSSLIDSSGSIENMSKEIAAQIQNSSAASEEQMASMEEITSSTESLAKLAEELQLLIGNIRF